MQSNNSGYLIKNIGSTYIFQKAARIFLDPTILLHCNNGDLILKNTLFISLINNNAQNKDIVQDLPKIEMIFELNKPLIKSILNPISGIFFNMNFYSSLNKNISNYNIYSSFIKSNNLNNHNLHSISQTLKINDANLVLKNNIFDVSLILLKNKYNTNITRIIEYLLKINNKFIKFNQYSKDSVVKIVELLIKSNPISSILLNLNKNKTQLKIFNLNNTNLLIQNNDTFLFLKSKTIIKNYISRVKLNNISNQFILKYFSKVNPLFKIWL